MTDPTKTSPLYRGHDWFNTESMLPHYGVQARIAPRKWVHVATGKEPLFFCTEAERDAYVKEKNGGR